jgi:formate C-acetyltransferase
VRKALDTSHVQESPRIQELIRDLYSSAPEIESERAVLVTEAYRGAESLPVVSRRAKALEHILADMTIVIRPGELIVGNLTTTPRSASVFPEYSCKWIPEELDRALSRDGSAFKITEETKDKLLGVLPYWEGKTVGELAERFMIPEAKLAMDHAVFSADDCMHGGIGHIGVDYEKVLKCGFGGIIREARAAIEKADPACPESIKKRCFLEAVIITSKAAIAFEGRFAELAGELSRQAYGRRSQELRCIARNCRNVPARGASSFYEALQSFWFVHSIIQIESNGHAISPMRFDQYLYPYYKADIESGAISREDAQELLDCLWVKFNDVNKLRGGCARGIFAGNPMFQSVTVGGQGKDGGDATNELSIACLEASRHVRLPEPSLSVRLWHKSPKELIAKASELCCSKAPSPVFFNDEAVIPALMSRGSSADDARDYGAVGNAAPRKGGGTDGRSAAAFFNMAKVLEITINNGRDGDAETGLRTGDFASFTAFGQLLNAYREQTGHFVSLMANAVGAIDLAHMERAPLPFVSSLVGGCLESGRTAQEGGARCSFTGVHGLALANTADSLYALKCLVFDEKKYSIERFGDALRSNFGGVVADISKNVLNEVIRRLISEEGTLSSEQAAKLGGLVFNTPEQSERSDDGTAELLRDIAGVPKFGNGHEGADIFAREIADIFRKEAEKHKNARGGPFLPGFRTAFAHVPFGEATGATPDGRRAGTPLSAGILPTNGKDKSGPYAAADSVAAIDLTAATAGAIFCQNFHPSALSGASGPERIAALVRDFFGKRGMCVQYSAASREALMTARDTHDSCRTLVSSNGCSVFFDSLEKNCQDDLISATEQMF